MKIKGLKCTHCPIGGDPTSQDILRENSDYILTSAGYSPSTFSALTWPQSYVVWVNGADFGLCWVFGAGIVCAVFQTDILPFQGSCSSCFP